MEPLTRRFLLDAGLQPGMRASTSGPASARACSLPTSSGRTAPSWVSNASGRRCRGHTTCREPGVGDVSFSGRRRSRRRSRWSRSTPAIGRFVLMYLADAADTIASVARHVRPGGTVGFQEWHGSDPYIAEPPVPLWTQTWECLVETFRRAGTNVHAGLRLRQASSGGHAVARAPCRAAEPRRCGIRRLPLPRGMIRSIEPMIENYRVATADELDIDTLEDRLRTGAAASGSTVAFSAIVSAPGPPSRQTRDATGAATRQLARI